ncbi:MAG: 4-(cytidine 5'-diphospho)-2-C-methyl-D-erythritol kinase [Burkholderiales bacterium]
MPLVTHIVKFFAPAKLNLFLHVIGRRPDGYHLLQSVFTLVDYGDHLEIDVRDDGHIRRRNVIAGVPAERDLAIRAAVALKATAGSQLGADISLQKRTPMGAGLGGGSSDAASVLIALNQQWKLGLPDAQLKKIGLSLGADVPFFIQGRSAFVEGIGELLTPVVVPPWWYVVVTPKVHVPTPFVFTHPDLTRTTPTVKIADFSATGFANYRNDLQPVVLKAFPEVASGLALLSAASKKSLFGARMTGSGASLFAAFESESDAREAFQKLSPKINGFVARGLEKHPHL